MGKCSLESSDLSEGEGAVRMVAPCGKSTGAATEGICMVGMVRVLVGTCTVQGNSFVVGSDVECTV